MSRELSLIIAIIIIVVLLVVFVTSYIIYKKMPVPKGCENLEINEENCAACNNTNCVLKKKKEGEN